MRPDEDRPPDERDLERALELAPRYDRPGPRYTSYPPAPHFHDGIGPPETRRVYEARGVASPDLSLYLHLPFCEEMCRFCACNVIVSRDRAIVDRYLASLLPEIDLAAQALSGGSRRVAQLHLGGGTPTYFPPDALARLHEHVASRFEILPDAEQALEVDPCVTTPAHAETLARLGFRRVSMGVQDLDARVQEAVHRIQSLDLTRDLVGRCRALGFQSVNVDLMYGLPFQTVEGFRRTLGEVIEHLDPDRVSLFGYAHVPWLKPHQRHIDEATLPSPATRLALFHEGVKAFVGAGYEFIGLDHFARPDDELARARRAGTLHRNFMGFHTGAGTDMVAFGITGIGDVSGTYLQNHHKLTVWEREVAAERLPVHRGYARTEDDVRRGGVIQALMCNGRAGRDVLAPGAPAGGDWRPAWPEEVARLEAMEADGVVRMDERGVSLTPLGRLFVRNVCMVFDAHLPSKTPTEEARPRYSRTV